MNSGVKRFLYKFVRRSFNLVGFELVRKGENHKISSRGWKERLQQAKNLGFSPRTILDGGAFRGHWSIQAAGLFPGAQLILVEPNPYVQEMIKSNTSQISPVPILLNLALGESPKKTSFNIWRDPDSDQGASLLNHVSGPASQTIQVNVETLDNILQKLSVFPDLIKLDLQGGELAALKGAPKTLKNAELAIIEFGCLDAYINRTTPRELIDIMYDNDFCLYDIVSCSDRPYDGALTGGDFFFVKNSSNLRKYKGWE